MYYYTVAKVGTGTCDDPYRPNIPDGYSYVSNESNDGTSFLVATSVEITGYTEVVDLQGACNNFGIDYNDVLIWRC